MQLKDAYKLMSSAYIDRESKEVPLLEKLCSFEDKSVLEITEQKSTVKSLLGKKYKLYVTIKPAELNTEDRQFDIVLTRWTTQYLENIVKAAAKMCSLSREAVIIIMPSEAGDMTSLKSMKDSETAARRRKRAFDVEQTIKKYGFRTMAIPETVRFRFKNANDALETFLATEFQNSVTRDQLKRIQAFLESKKIRRGIEITQGVIVVYGSRR